MAASSPREITESILDHLLCFHQIVLLELESTGLTWTQFNAVCMVAEHRELNMSEVATQAGNSNASVTTMIDRLEALECVTRTRSKQDRRQVNVSVGEKGATHSEDP